MYDRDLKVWYRELFLYPSPRRSLRRRPSPGPLRPMGADHLTPGEFPVGNDSQRLTDHERPQASY
jgi:hypothetical protein